MVEIQWHSQTKERATANTNFNLHRRASPRPYLRGTLGETPEVYSPLISHRPRTVEENSPRRAGERALVLLDPLFTEFPCERAAVHSEAPGSLRDVKASLGEHLVNPLPFQGLDRGLSFGEAYVGIPLGAAERRFDVVRI